MHNLRRLWLNRWWNRLSQRARIDSRNRANNVHSRAFQRIHIDNSLRRLGRRIDVLRNSYGREEPCRPDARMRHRRHRSMRLWRVRVILRHRHKNWDRKCSHLQRDRNRQRPPPYFPLAFSLLRISIYQTHIQKFVSHRTHLHTKIAATTWENLRRRSSAWLLAGFSAALAGM